MGLSVGVLSVGFRVLVFECWCLSVDIQECSCCSSHFLVM